MGKLSYPGERQLTAAERAERAAERKAAFAKAAQDAWGRVAEYNRENPHKEAVAVAHESEPPPKEAASSTVEALMLSLRARGVTALADENTQRRLAELSSRQVGQVIDRLQKLRPRYPQISDELIAVLQEQAR